jgi:DNA-directed RNA polymerase subunit E'/Rpb7
MNNYSPYITTELTSSVSLDPRQMDNNIYKNLKNNLIKRFEGKCFKDYGFISKIYDVTKYSDGYVVAENPKSAARFYITFTCKLCYPLLKKQIICKIDKANRLIMRLNNGPINVLVTTKDRINKSIFFVDTKTGNLMAKKDGKSVVITIGSYVKVTVESRQFNDQDTMIMAMGFLEDIATDEEVKKSYEKEYGMDNLITYDNYVDQEKYTNEEDIDQKNDDDDSEAESEEPTESENHE